ncbi:hypothetical protein C8R47DRAFT_336507, partial [Mycena vitilis]
QIGPGLCSGGVAGRGFPFYFWPSVWGYDIGHNATAVYMHSDECGGADSTRRPGGPMAMAVLQSKATANGTTFRLFSDDSTISGLMPIFATNRLQYLTAVDVNAIAPTPIATGGSLPEQGVQYYRASSVLLNLDDYNSSAVFAAESSIADVPPPSITDTDLLDCTIAQAVLLVDGARSMTPPPNLAFVLLCFLLVVLRKGLHLYLPSHIHLH